MKSRAKIIAISAIYILAVIALLLYLNKKRSSEYSYTADLSYYSVEFGKFSESDSALYTDESYDSTGVFAASPGMQFRAGEYDITVNYRADGDNSVHMSANENYEEYIGLPAEEASVTTHVTIFPAADEFRIWFIYNGSGAFCVDSVTVTGDKPLYTDYEYFMVLTVVFGILIPVVLFFILRKKSYTKEDRIRSAVLAAVAVIMNFPVFYGYLWMGVDMRPHLMRIDGVGRCIDAHRIPTLIYPNYCNSYGELSCIYPDKFLYIPGFLRSMGVSLISSYCTIHVIVNVATLVIMYKCVRYITGKGNAALVSAVMYAFIPYRVYVMCGASQTLGNGLAMAFIPLVFTGMYDILFLKGRRWYLLAIGMASIICSHVLSAVLAAVVCGITFVFYILVMILTRKRITADVVKGLLLATVTCVVLCLSTLTPFVYYMKKGLNVEKMSVNFLESIQSLSSDFLSENGIFHIMVLIVTVVMIIRFRKAKVRFTDPYPIYGLFMLIAGFVLFIMTTRLFPWELFAGIQFIYSKLCMLQFAERFMLAGCAALSIGFGMLYDLYSDCVGETDIYKRFFAAILIVFAVIGCSETYRGIAACDMLIPDRMSGNIYYKQIGYLPPGSQVDYYVSSVPNLGEWDGVEHVSYVKDGTHLQYIYKNPVEGNYIEFPLFYYDGYLAADETGEVLPIKVSDHNRIVVDMATGPDQHLIDVSYNVNPIFYVAAVISLLATIVLYIYIFIGLKKEPDLTAPDPSVPCR